MAEIENNIKFLQLQDIACAIETFQSGSPESHEKDAKGLDYKYIYILAYLPFQSSI